MPSLSGSLGKGTLSARTREQLALAIGQANQCDYWVAAHSAIGKTVGLTAIRSAIAGWERPWTQEPKF